MARRTVTSKAAAVLVLLYRYFAVGSIVSVSAAMKQVQAFDVLVKTREWRKLKYWGLLEEVPPDNGQGNDLIRLTDRGLQFALQGAAVYKIVYTYDDRVIHWEVSKTVTITEVLSAEFIAVLTGQATT